MTRSGVAGVAPLLVDENAGRRAMSAEPIADPNIAFRKTESRATLFLSLFGVPALPAAPDRGFRSGIAAKIWNKTKF
jgi:hypothetical protein